MKTCPSCKKGKPEMIGVTDRQQYKWYCPLCYKISFGEKLGDKKEVAVPRAAAAEKNFKKIKK